MAVKTPLKMEYFSGSSALDYFLVRTSNTFDSISAKQLPFETYPDFIAPIVNGQNLIVLTDDLWGFDFSGNILFREYVGAYGYYRAIATPSGYSLVSDATEDQVHISHRDALGKPVSITEFPVPKENFRKARTEFTSPDVLTIHYAEANPTSEDYKSYTVKRTIAGNILYEKEYSFGQTMRSFQLSSGELLEGVTGGYSQYVFTKVDALGNVEWEFRDPQEQYYPNYYAGADVSVIEKDGFIYIFYDNMKGAKLSPDGNVIWHQRFTLREDTFNAAIVNDRGNFVLLGTHQFDYQANDFTPDYQKRDLILLEVDTNGQIVN
jgi:hypothetical protein